MCGIAGIWDRSLVSVRGIENNINDMADTLSHRGPDASGVWADKETGIAFGHRRLSILDLSSAGHQPMISSCGRYVVIHNGEVYNFLEIRKELEACGRQFKSNSDTEVILESLSEWGIEKAIHRFNGMFALGLWDREAGLMYLVRDRIGKKPLYVYHRGNFTLFASELKALLKHPVFTPVLDMSALTSFMRYLYVPSPKCIFQDVTKVLPGHYAVINSTGEMNTFCYWNIEKIFEQATTDKFNLRDNETIRHFEELLRKSISQRMISDVPIGVLLSGGIDSSIVTAMMQEQSNVPIKTFTIGFKEGLYNEATYASEVANRLATEHTELYVTPNDALSVVDLLPGIFDEPFADSSQIPSILVSQLTRQKVTVALSGDGGDEIFGGYNRYIWGRKLSSVIRYLPLSVRNAISSMMTVISPATLNNILKISWNIMPRKLRQQQFGDRVHKMAEFIKANDSKELYLYFVSTWKDPGRAMIGEYDENDRLSVLLNGHKNRDFIDNMMFWDMMTYLPDDILTKVDRSSMSVGLEVRTPFLDYKIVEESWRLPMEHRIYKGSSKWILRNMLSRYLPDDLIERPKAGFAVPIDSWLRGPLKDWAYSLLDKDKIERDGIFNYDVVRKLWDEHLSKSHNRQYELWDILMFQAWKDKWL